jgi:hypothetical protein
MTVARNKFERVKNDPNNPLHEEVQAAAFIAYPYRHATKSKSVGCKLLVAGARLSATSSKDAKKMPI